MSDVVLAVPCSRSCIGNGSIAVLGQHSMLTRLDAQYIQHPASHAQAFHHSMQAQA